MHPFLQNKYTDCYFRIINYRRQNCLSQEMYKESHHIIPRSLGGSNDRSNLVNLTLREHLICHFLLTKMTDGAAKYKMIFAANAMTTWPCGKFQRNLNKNRTYEMIKSQCRSLPRSDETRAKMSASAKVKFFTDEHRANIGKAGLGRKQSIESIEKTRLAHIGSKRSEETKRKIADKRATQIIKRKMWILQNPSGNIIETKLLKDFCKANRLGLSKLLSTQKTKKPVERGYSTGWMIINFYYPQGT